MQGSLFRFLRINNRFLFSDYYLDKLLPNQDDFKFVEGFEKLFKDIKNTYFDKKDNLSAHSEGALEHEFIRPTLDKLGHIYEPLTSLLTYEGVKHPDYAFFQTKEDKDEALKYKGTKQFWTKAIAVGDAKAWDRQLDKKLKGPGDPFDNSNPSFQIDYYLRESDKRWGILTNGRYWRLYNRENSYKLGIYYEIDLAELLEHGSLEDFKYFYLFFRREAFVAEDAKSSFLDRVFQGSINYAKEVGERLKSNVYEALRLLCEGFLRYPNNNLLPSDLGTIHENALVYLYRLLFILYAESLGLLPVNTNKNYSDTLSLKSLKEEIARDKDNRKFFPLNSTRYWDSLSELFEIINSGRKRLDVQAYNGGLFDPAKHPFLDEKDPKKDETIRKIPDSYLAEVVDFLARTEGEKGEERAFVDYRSLSVQHLGSIYEGLLEYKVRHADKELIVVREKGIEKHIPIGEKLTKNQRDTGKRVKPGESYLETDKGERKATGSYYTPEYIVKYIVENTLRPLCQQIENKIRVSIKELEGKIKTSRGANREAHEKALEEIKASFDDEILKLKVLDPAMGSGHFLVRAVEYLAEEISTNPYAYEEGAPEDEAGIDYWKRKVVEHCIYGVDLNPLAVELTKLSLWLVTVSKGKPLSFLDHHLLCGNSLVGARLQDLMNPPKPKKGKKETKSLQKEQQIPLFDESQFTKDVSLIMGDYKIIEKLPSDTVEQVKEKDRILRELIDTRRERYIKQADLWTSAFFGNEMDENIYQDLVRHINGDGAQLTKEQARPSLKNAEDLAEDKGFFHWELEFPEVFFGRHQRKDNPGFDAVIANPPYLRIQTLNQVDLATVRYFNQRFNAIGGSYDIYSLFVEQGRTVLNVKGSLGFILPHKFFQADYGEGLRRWLSEQRAIKSIVDFGSKQVFEDATTYTCLLFLDGSPRDHFYYVPPQNPTDIATSDYTPSEKLDQSVLGAKAWTFGASSIRALHTKLSEQSEPLSETASRIFQGLKTSADRIYILEIQRDLGDKLEVYSQQREKTYRLERELLKPLIKGGDSKRYDLQRTNRAILFPYRHGPDGKVQLIPEDTMKQHFPFTYAYLVENKSDLKGRERGALAGKQWYAFGRTQALDVISLPKIFTPDFAREASYSLDVTGEQFFTGGAAGGYGILVKPLLSTVYVLALLNSKLLNSVLRSVSTVFRGGWFSYEARFISNLPIHRINFTASKKERKKLLEKGRALYEKCIQKNDEESILGFLENNLSTTSERSDVVHDLLAYLAEQMIEMNKEKQNEIKGFLTWLESYLGVKIHDLINKTKFKSYYEASWEDLLEVLESNQRRIDKVDITRREPQEKIKKEFEDSLAKLNPLLSRIQATDDLIDQIVYKLYELTEEEVKIVKEQLGKNDIKSG